MKSLLIILFTSFMIVSWSQCDNNVKTDPDNAQNAALPDDGASINTPDQRYLNGLEWWQDGFYTLTNMQYNPSQTYPDMANIQDPNSIEYYSYLIEALGAEEMNPQNGWEMMLVNLGRYPNNTTALATNSLREVPYICLYNIYTGKLRIFVQYGYNQPPALAIDGLRIKLKYQINTDQYNRSTILRLGAGVDNSLDVTSSITELSAIVPPNGSAFQWMSADMQLTYDPCVCKIPTKLTIECTYFSETDLELSGRSVSIENDLIQNGQVANLDFLSGVGEDGENGYIIYEKMATLADDYIQKMSDYKTELASVGEYNEGIEKKLLAVKIFKQVVNVGLLAATGTPGFAQFATLWPAINFKKDNGDIDTTKSQKFYGQIEEILTEYLNTFVSESLKKKDDPTEPVMPTVTLSQMEFRGTLYDEDYVPSILFNTPGSFVNNPAVNNLPVVPGTGYPVYNQPVGVFALLEEPKLLRSNKSVLTTYNCEVHQTQAPDPVDFYGVLNNKNVVNRVQFKLKDPLKYTFNPALDYKSKTVEAMFVLKPKINYTANKGLELAPTTPETFPYESEIRDASVNLTSSNINTYSNETLFDYENSVGWYSGATILKEKDTMTFFSDYIPIDAFNNFIVELSTIENFNLMSGVCEGNVTAASLNRAIWEDLDVQIKLKVNVEYLATHSNGDPHIYTYIFTYNIGDDDITLSSTEIYPNLAGSAADISQYPQDLSFDVTAFNGSPIEGCELVGTQYTCKSWDYLEITDDITIAPGYSVNFIAGNLIEVFPESEVPSQSTLSIQPVLNYSNPMPEQSATYVSNFCSGNNPNGGTYKGNQPTNKTSQNSNGTDTVITEGLSDNDFVLFPNPTADKVQLLFNYAVINPEVVITDISGKKIQSEISVLGDKSFLINLENFASGVYLVTISTQEGTTTKQLIKR